MTIKTVMTVMTVMTIMTFTRQLILNSTKSVSIEIPFPEKRKIKKKKF